MISQWLKIVKSENLIKLGDKFVNRIINHIINHTMTVKSLWKS